MNLLTSNTQRAISIDVFRGIIIFTMIFVNELAGIKDIPHWMQHMHANEDGMTFVDLVFPAFLFIVGMSIPFSIQARLNKGESHLSVFKHIVLRSVGLIIIGVFMVNTESGYDASLMSISLPLWSLLLFIYVLLIWSNYPKSLPPLIPVIAKLLGATGLIMLWWLYKGPDNTGMTTQWWGILGLIGWANLIASTFFLLSQKCQQAKSQLLLLIFIAISLMVAWFALNEINTSIAILSFLIENNGNHVLAAIALCGAIMSQIFFLPNFLTAKVKYYAVFCIATFLLAFASWQLVPISKIGGTPSWALFSIFFCCLIFGFVYWLVDVKQHQQWCKLFEPAATNPLLIYIMPWILDSILNLTGISIRPSMFDSGGLGMIWSLFFASVIMLIGAGLTRMGLRVKL